MAVVSYFTRLLALALAELSDPVTSAKVTAAFRACAKKISKSAIVYHYRRLNP